jgi:hypothetical protein
MRESRSLLTRLVTCGVALAVVSTLAAETVTPGTAKVIRIKGEARYSTAAGNNLDWKPLKVGDVLKPGTLVQSADPGKPGPNGQTKDVLVDIALGEGTGSVGRPVAGDLLTYQPNVERNLVRMYGNTLLRIDRLDEAHTGANVVSTTHLDLRAGHIFGMVKRQSAGSEYMVTVPAGVAAIRGTVFHLHAEGKLLVLSGEVLLRYTSPRTGTEKTQSVREGQEFDPSTEQTKTTPDVVKTGMINTYNTLKGGLTPPPGTPTPSTDATGGSTTGVVPTTQVPVAIPPSGFVSPH